MASCDRVLLVEADSISNQLLSFSLQREGFEVIQALSGPEGLSAARAQLADIVLSEVLLPEMDGYEMCRQLRADWNTQRIPIVLITSLGGAENRMRGLLAGADDYLVKPYDLRELVIRLRRLISTYSNSTQLHPLTRLPGGQLVRSYIEEMCLRDPQGRWALLRLDLNHFKVYNQVYGFNEGDGVLRVVADLLRNAVQSRCHVRPSFVGHEGGDDFIAVVPLDRAEELSQTIIHEFAERIAACYPLEHRNDQYHVLLDRTGVTQLVPHLSLAIGVVTGDLCKNLGYLELREIAQAVTNKAKAEGKSAACFNRRHLPGRSLQLVAQETEKVVNPVP